MGVPPSTGTRHTSLSADTSCAADDTYTYRPSRDQPSRSSFASSTSRETTPVANVSGTCVAVARACRDEREPLAIGQ
jgi:hypothetical protein